MEQNQTEHFQMQSCNVSCMRTDKSCMRKQVINSC